MKVLKIKFENWNFGKLFENLKFWKLNLKIGILENYLRMKLKKKIKFLTSKDELRRPTLGLLG